MSTIIINFDGTMVFSVTILQLIAYEHVKFACWSNRCDLILAIRFRAVFATAQLR